MEKQIKQLEQFQKAFGGLSNTKPTLIPRENFLLRIKLSQEELNEYKDACLDEDIVEVFDAILDRLFLAFGDAVEHGLQNVLEKGFNEVMRSNMSKLDDNGEPLINGINCKRDETRPYGKVLKSKNYTEPNLKQFL